MVEVSLIMHRCSYRPNSRFVSQQALQVATAKQMELEETVEALQHRSSSGVRVRITYELRSFL
jgi:hypothetical protein